MTSLSALLNTTTPDTMEFNNIHSYEEITFCNLAALTENAHVSRMTSRPPLIETIYKFPSMRSSVRQHFSTQRLAVQQRIIWQSSILPL